MENSQILEAQPRETGKKATRAVRCGGQVPCILYGHHVEPVPFQLPGLTLRRLAYAREARRVEIALDGEQWNCILKEIELHPVTDEPIHADFQVLKAGEEIRLTVPIHFEGTPHGQTEGGDTQFVLNEVDIICLPENIPNHVEVDISGLDIGEAIHIADLAVEGVAFDMAPEQTVVTVVAPYVEPTTTVAEEELLEAELAEEGELAELAEGELPAEEGAEGEVVEEAE